MPEGRRLSWAEVRVAVLTSGMLSIVCLRLAASPAGRAIAGGPEG